MQTIAHDTNGIQGTQSLSRGLAVLTAFSEQRRELSVAELAQHLELSRPTAYRLAKTLEQHGFLKFNPTTRTYSIGPVTFTVGNLFLPSSFSNAVGEIMRDLRIAATHTVHVAVIDGNSLLNIGADESLNMARVVSHVGQRTPLHATAAGKAYLASLPNATVLGIVADTGLPKVASRTITDIDQLLSDLELTRKRGYGVGVDELADGIHAFGMAVQGHASTRPHTIAVSQPTGTLYSAQDEELLVRHLREAAKRLAVVIAQYPR